MGTGTEDTDMMSRRFGRECGFFFCMRALTVRFARTVFTERNAFL